jgi:cytochrome c2
LFGVLGRKAGSSDFSRYKGLVGADFSRYKGLVGADFSWDPNLLDQYLQDPKGIRHVAHAEQDDGNGLLAKRPAAAVMM